MKIKRDADERKMRGNCTFFTPTRIFPGLGHLPLHNVGITTVPNPQTTWWPVRGDRMAIGQGQKDPWISLRFTSYKERPRADFVLAFLELFENIKFNDENLFSADKFRIFEIKISKSRNSFFLLFHTLKI
jgi:hypothetical protein